MAGMQALAEVPDHAVGGIGGQEVHGGVGVLCAERPGDGEVALDVAEADRARQEEDAPRGASGAGGFAVGRSVVGGMVRDSTGRSRTKSRMSWLTLTASRPGRPWPPPSKVTSRAPGIVSAISAPTL